VTLVVTDAAGVPSAVADSLIIIVQGPSTISPSANFNFSCISLNCTFADTSFEPDPAVTIGAYDWDFGDGTPHDATPNPSHTYVASSPTTEHVTLTVTDTLARTFSVTKDVPVAPVGLTCGNGSDDSVSCPMLLPQKSTVTITLTSANCGAAGNTLRISSPITETIFTNGCYETPGTVYTINGGDAFNPGTLLAVAVNSGVTGPDRIPPAVIVGGAYPSWTINYDDGGFASYPGEPDFNDLVLTVDVTVVP
jgi:PKD repeat protein